MQVYVIVTCLCADVMSVVIDAPFQIKSGEQTGEPKMTSHVVTNLRVGVSEKAMYFRSFRYFVVQ